MSGLRILLLADTHGTVDGRIVQLARECDWVIHAGDIGRVAVLTALEPRQGRVIAVRGNNDSIAKWPEHEASSLETLPLSAELSLPGGILVVVHGDRAGGAAGRHAWLRGAHPRSRAGVYGHSHGRACARRAVPWIRKPGAAGGSRTYGGPPCLVLNATEPAWRVEAYRFAPLHPGK